MERTPYFYYARVTFLLMVALFLWVALVTPSIAADAVASASANGNMISIHTEKPCSNLDVLKVIERHRMNGARIPTTPIWRLASGHFDGKDYPEMCWYATQDGAVVAVFPDGDATMWSIRDFKKDTKS